MPLDKTPLPRCKSCLDHPGWAHGDQLRRSEPDDVCPDCHGSGVHQVKGEKVDIVGAIMAVEEGYASPLETLETFGLLLREGVLGSLQGSWQRAVAEAISAGFIDPETGNLTDYAIESLGDLDESDEY